MKQVLILGGGFGGVKAALKLARHANFQIKLISDRDYFQYYPTLYRSATGRSHIESAIPLVDIFKNHLNVEVIIDQALSLNPKTKTVKTKKGKLYGYNELIIALGSVTNYFNIKGLRQYSYGIKSIKEAMELKHHLHQELTDEHKPDLNYVIVGGGPTGIELAGALLFYLRQIMRWHKVWQKNVSIDLIEAAPRLLPRSHPKVSAWVAERLKGLGINVMVGQSVQAETYNKLMVSGHAIATRTVIWTAGVANHPFFTNNQPLFRLDDHGKVMVDRFLQARPHIYVLGDNTNTPYSGMAQTALHDARLVSRNLIRAGRSQPRMAYRPSRPISIIPVGSKWATLEWGPIHLRGRLIARLRRTADLIAYLDIEPLQRAARIWLSDNQPEEDCPICDQLANEAAAAK